MKTNRFQNQTGFTLLELIVYVGIFSLLVGIVVTFYISSVSMREKHRVIAEVELQGAQAMQQITQAIRNADSITLPAAGAQSATSLILATTTSATNPTVIDLTTGVLGIKEGASTRVSLTTMQIAVSDLSFQNLSRTSTAGIIKIQFTITYTTTSTRQEYQYVKTFYGAAALREIIQ